MFGPLGKVVKRKGLQREIVWYLGVLAVLSVAIVGGLVLKISQELLKDQAIHHARGAALVAAELFSSGWDASRPDGGAGRNQRVFEHLQKDSGLSHWTLFSTRGEVLTGIRPERSEKREVQNAA